MRCPATLITLSVNPPVILKASIPILWSRKRRLQEVQWTPPRHSELQPARRGSVLWSPRQLQPQQGGLGHTYPGMLLTHTGSWEGQFPRASQAPFRRSWGAGGLCAGSRPSTRVPCTQGLQTQAPPGLRRDSDEVGRREEGHVGRGHALCQQGRQALCSHLNLQSRKPDF